MTLKELKKWKCRAEKCVEIYKNNGKDTSTAKVTIPADKFLDLTDTAINASSQQEKTAAWVPTDEKPYEAYGGRFKKCNACGWLLYDIDTTDFKYCPNCGARMQEVEENG